MKPKHRNLIRLLLICYLTVFATPIVFAFPCNKNMETMSAEHSENHQAISSPHESNENCCEQLDSALSAFSCDSVCISINFYLEIGDSLISKILPLGTPPIDVEDGILAGFASVEPHPPQYAL